MVKVSSLYPDINTDSKEEDTSHQHPPSRYFQFVSSELMGIDTRGKRRLLAGSKLSIYLMSRSPSVRHCLFYHNRTLHTYNEEKITLFFMSHNAENMLFHFVHLYSVLMFWHYSLRSGARSPPEPNVIGSCTLST